MRSEINERSSSARTPIICHIARPLGEFVVDRFGQGAELDAALLKVVKHLYEITEAPSKSVELPDNERVAGLHGVEATKQPCAPRGGPRCPHP